MSSRFDNEIATNYQKPIYPMFTTECQCGCRCYLRYDIEFIFKFNLLDLWRLFNPCFFCINCQGSNPNAANIRVVYSF